MKFFKDAQTQNVPFKRLKYKVEPHFLVTLPTESKPTTIRGKAGYTSTL